MTRILILLSLFSGFARVVSEACTDTTFEVTGTGPVTYNTAALNAYIAGCEDTIPRRFTLENKSTNDTVKFSNEIIVTSRPNGVKTEIVGKGRDGGTFTVGESILTDPLLFDIKALNPTIISGFTIVRKAEGSGSHSVAIAAKGSIIRDCHLFRSDNSSTSGGALVSITADSVLVERCLFRAPPNGKGRTIAITTAGTALKNEFRSNIFYSTGFYLTAGSQHIFANTFAGSFDYPPIIVGTGVANPGTAVDIQHNLFAIKVDTLAPIFFAGTQTSAESILKNAWTKSKPGVSNIAVNNAGVYLTLINATNANANIELRKGFSRYGTHVAGFKEYPLVSLRSDSTLSRSHADFGKIPRVYNNTVSTWTSMPDISAGLPNAKLHFSADGNTFTPFIQGTTWNTNAGVGIKVGALVDLEARAIPPSPLDSGAVNAGLAIARHASDSTKMKVTNINFNRLWYDTTIPPAEMLFFFSTSRLKLQANDSTALMNPVSGTPYYTRRNWSGFDSVLDVPKEVRINGNPIYVKMLHYNAGGQAATVSDGSIALVTGIPGFPINDLARPVVDSSSDTLGGSFRVNVIKQGSEAIDSITVTVQRAGGGGTQTTQTKAAPAQGAAATFTFDLPSGSFQFVAAPVAKVGASTLTGSPTAATRAYTSRAFQGTTVYVAAVSGTTGCSTRTGLEGSPFCTIDTALAVLATKNGGTIVVKNGTPAVAFQDMAINAVGGDTSPVTITAPVTAGASGSFDAAHRAVFRGSAATPAITVNRKNVILRGFIVEMPAGSNAPAVLIASSASGSVVDGCLFRPSSKAQASGPAVSIETAGNGEARFVSNVVWGFTTAVRISSGSNAIRILHNTFIDEPAVNTSPTIGISAPAPSLQAVVANNYFSGIDTAFAANVALKTLTLDHNLYTIPAPVLQGQSELGGLDNVPRLGELDLTVAGWAQNLKLAMETITECSTVKPCQPLYAGSSSNPYGPPIATDVMGKARLGKAEVGAFEAEASTSSVRGVLAMSVTPMSVSVLGGDTKLPFVVTRKTFDPLDADSLHVWWSTATGADLDNNILQVHQDHYGIDVLKSGTFADTATGLNPLTNYTVYAALGKTTNGTRVLGYGYRAAGTTPAGFTVDDCKLEPGNLTCPVKVDVFSVPNGEAKDKFFTRVKFALADSGGVKVPEFRFAQPESYSAGRVEIASPLPRITLSIDAALTKVPGSQQSWTAQIRMVDDPGTTLDDKELFILPSDPAGLPTYVPTWRLRKEGNEVWLDIEGTESGTFTYAFGNMAATAEAGKVIMTNPADQPPRFSFKTGKEIDSVALTIRGSGFATANPLIMVTPISAGGTYANPINGKYPNKSLFITSKYSGLHETVRMDRFRRYYEKAVKADSKAVSVGIRKPFTLSPADAEAFAFNSILTLPSLAVSNSGESGEIPVNLPINTRYREAELYPDTMARASRSIEVVFTTFDGSKISRTSGYIRTEFSDSSAIRLHSSEKQQFPDWSWNLFAYPWDEADTGSLARIVKASSWSKSDHRLMKYKGTGTGSGAFIHYDGTSSEGITYDAGRAAWSGAKGFYEPTCLNGISLDYQPFSLALTAGAWNDFGLPFNFPMKWRDILNASGLNGDEFKVWRYVLKKDNEMPHWELLTGKDVVRPWQGLTAHPATAVTLIFPVMDTSRSSTPLAKPAAGEIWSARIRAYNGTALMKLRIGKGPREEVSPEAPDVPGQDFRVSLGRATTEGLKGVSEHVQAGEDWRGHWPLSGRAPKEGIRLSAGENEREIPIYLVETMSRRTVLLAPGTEVALTQEELASGDYHLVAGDSRYLQDVLDGLVPLHMLALSNYPNPFSGSTLIRYALPESFGKVEFRMRIRDSRGRLVWEKTHRGGSSLRYLWDGRDNRGRTAPSGFYTLSLEAAAPGKATQRAVRSLLKM